MIATNDWRLLRNLLIRFAPAPRMLRGSAGMVIAGLVIVVLGIAAPSALRAQGNSNRGQQTRVASNPEQQRQQAAVPQRQPFQDLTREEIDYRDKILEYWEQSSAQYKNFRCAFRRHTYDSAVVGYRDPQTQRLASAEIATGEIFFAAPEHGRYQTEQVWTFANPPKEPGAQADYELQKAESAQAKWICDGKVIYEFDYGEKRLYETVIPENMRGPEGLSASPIPFLFGARKDVLLNRYWVRVITPREVQGEYWLEVHPKRAEDARNYSKIEVIIDEKDFLPKAMRMFSPQYDPARGNFAHMMFEFLDRRTNTLAFEGLFGRPQKPISWTRQKRSFLGE